MSPSAVATDTFTRAAQAPRSVGRQPEPTRSDDSLSGAHILNRGERPLELSLLMTHAGKGGVVSVRNRDRQPQLARVLMLRRRVASARDCLGQATVSLEAQHDGTIIAIEVPAGATVDVRFRVARAEEKLAHEEPRAQAAAAVVRAAVR
jgi:hypothetical protein